MENQVLTGELTYEQHRAQKQLKIVDIKDAIVSIFTSTGIAGFKFHIVNSEQIRMQSDITDHYTDINSAVQDHVARKPIKITLGGYQGEYYYTVHPIENMIAKVAPVLTLIEVFKPKINAVTQKIKQKQVERQLIKINNVDKTAAENYHNTFAEKEFNAVDLFRLFLNIYKFKSKQTQAFFFFEALWQSDLVFTVETSWKIYNNLIIEDITALRDNNADITDFTITFKQVGITTSKSESIKDVAGRLQAQAAQVTQKGIDKGKEVDTLNPNKEA